MGTVYITAFVLACMTHAFQNDTGLAYLIDWTSVGLKNGLQDEGSQLSNSLKLI